MCHMSNFAITISDSQQKYVVLIAMGKSGGISKILLMNKLESKVDVSFRIGLYFKFSSEKGELINVP